MWDISQGNKDDDEDESVEEIHTSQNAWNTRIKGSPSPLDSPSTSSPTRMSTTINKSATAIGKSSSLSLL